MVVEPVSSYSGYSQIYYTVHREANQPPALHQSDKALDAKNSVLGASLENQLHLTYENLSRDWASAYFRAIEDINLTYEQWLSYREDITRSNEIHQVVSERIEALKHEFDVQDNLVLAKQLVFLLTHPEYPEYPEFHGRILIFLHEIESALDSSQLSEFLRFVWRISSEIRLEEFLYFLNYYEGEYNFTESTYEKVGVYKLYIPKLLEEFSYLVSQKDQNKMELTESNPIHNDFFDEAEATNERAREVLLENAKIHEHEEFLHREIRHEHKEHHDEEVMEYYLGPMVHPLHIIPIESGLEIEVDSIRAWGIHFDVTLLSEPTAFIVHHSSGLYPFRIFSGEVSCVVTEKGWGELEYASAFDDLLKAGYKTIFVLTPGPAFSNDEDMVLNLKKEYPHVFPINTNTYGLGLGLILVDFLSQGIPHKLKRKVIKDIQNRSFRMGYWVAVVKTPDRVEKEWFDLTVPDHIKHRREDGNMTHLFTFQDHPRYMGFYLSIMSLLNSIEREIDEDMADSGISYRRLYVTYHESYDPEVSHFLKRIKVKYPKLLVFQIGRHHYLENEFGAHIGIAII